MACICNLFFCLDTRVNWVGPVLGKWWCMAAGKYSESDVTRLFNSKCVTAWGCQADHLKPCVWWWQRPPIVLGFDLGPDERFPCGADVNTRSAMSARAKHSRDSEVREKKKKSNFLNFFSLSWTLKLHFFFYSNAGPVPCVEVWIKGHDVERIMWVRSQFQSKVFIWRALFMRRNCLKVAIF